MNWLMAIRKEKGFSQSEISNIVKIKQATYCNIENGKRRPSVKTAKKIAAVLGFDWTEFFKD